MNSLEGLPSKSINIYITPNVSRESRQDCGSLAIRVYGFVTFGLSHEYDFGIGAME